MREVKRVQIGGRGELETRHAGKGSRQQKGEKEEVVKD